MTDHDLLTINEAADLVRAPVATLRYWRHLGTGPRSFRVGRRVLYQRAEIDAWIDGQARADRDRVRPPGRPFGGEPDRRERPSAAGYRE